MREEAAEMWVQLKLERLTEHNPTMVPVALPGSPGVSRRERCALFTDLLDIAIAITGADMGNIQLLEPAVGALQIEAQRGFKQPFLEYFDRVHDGEAACGTALKHAERIIIQDVTDSPIFLGTPALEVMLDAGARGVQSTPLVGCSGRILSVLSTHYRRPRPPYERALRRLDGLARQLADLIEREIHPNPFPT